VETSNYRTVRLPSDVELPVYVKDVFADFYRDMFAEQVRRERMRTVFLEYAWDMNWCDPCAAEPLAADELRDLGVFWVSDVPVRPIRPPQPPRPRPIPKGGAVDVYVTRLHLRYTAETFPEDLAFMETGDRSSFQGRYVIRHPWRGEIECPAARQYREDLARRREREAETLASLTGWDVNDVRERQGAPPEPVPETPWWKKLWQHDDEESGR
jgi:hypothetical protein